MNFKKIILFFILCLLIGCGGTSGNGTTGDDDDDNNDNDDNDETISMTTPYANESDIEAINEAFSSDSSAPWGFAHGGIDFFPASNLISFQAVAAGTVGSVSLTQNDITSNWQVEIGIEFNSTYSFSYTFEPMSLVQADGETQQSNISVTDGQSVSQGDAIGNLLVVGEDTHVHFGLLQNNSAICPETYFTAEASSSILSIIHADNPDWDMCY